MLNYCNSVGYKLTIYKINKKNRVSQKIIEVSYFDKSS